jgi:hypothetical protein
MQHVPFRQQQFNWCHFDSNDAIRGEKIYNIH